MKILVYGAGVMGCELTHVLVGAGRYVTLLARGKWKNALEQNGLTIRHPAQMQTTTDCVHLVDHLAPEDLYDLIFVAVQYAQLPSALPALAANRSHYVVLVGNNADAETALRVLTEGHPEREVAFGFQNTAGRRESDRVVSLHAGVGMTVGACRGSPSEKLHHRIERAFHGARYRLTWQSDMGAWLKGHLALILPFAYVCYAVDGRLSRATAAQRRAILDAAGEACAMLRRMGVPLSAVENDAYYRPGGRRRQMQALLLLLFKTPIGRLAAGEHCQSAVTEMQALDETFQHFRACAGLPMPAWEQLRRQARTEVVGTVLVESGGGR